MFPQAQDKLRGNWNLDEAVVIGRHEISAPQKNPFVAAGTEIIDPARMRRRASRKVIVFFRREIS
jgi:hypothetical protein